MAKKVYNTIHEIQECPGCQCGPLLKDGEADRSDNHVAFECGAVLELKEKKAIMHQTGACFAGIYSPRKK